MIRRILTIIICITCLGWFLLLGPPQYKPEKKMIGFVEFHFYPYVDKQNNIQWRFILNGLIRF